MLMDNMDLLADTNLVLLKISLLRLQMGNKHGIEFSKMGHLANIQTYNFHII
jgi:hypothetical protein